ncbi:MAG: universal stress protein [Pseudomonas sp.]|uniref:universal stress protein n=1 Tax=Pseudomonas sp. TaxID=306 RepID=UPI002732E9A9|nr:universal stress protein [Pseudomonas sp.]MDP3845057.1 universal stress protein [Pseudomonas sp.]
MKQTAEPALPEPTLTERDSDGRLIGVVVDCPQPLPAAADNAWLVAIDGSAHSLRATAEAARLAGLIKSGVIHLLNVQPWLGKEAAQSELLRRGWAATAAARGLLDASGSPWRLHVLMGDAAECIVALASRLGGVIVIGSNGLGATEALLLGSVAYQVLHLSKAPVLVVR